MDKKIFIFLFFLIIIVGSVVTSQEQIEEQIPSFQFNQDFDLKRSCFNNGFFCTSDFVCNITLVSPKGNLLVDNKEMTRTNSYYNMSVLASENNELGFIKASQSCNNGTLAGPDTFLVAITSDGAPYEKFPKELFFIIVTFAITLVGFLNDRLRILKHSGGILLMILGILTLYPGYSFINYSTLLGKGIGTVLIGLGFYFLIEDSFSRNKQQEGFDSPSEYVEEYEYS